MWMLLSLLTVSAHVPVFHRFMPGEDWCAFVRGDTARPDGTTFHPGDVVTLEPGAHRGCAFEGATPDEAGELTVIQSVDPDAPAQVGPLTVGGTAVLLSGLELSPTDERPGIDIVDGDGIWVRGNQASTFSGTAVVIRGSSDQVWVVDNVFSDGGQGVDVQAEAGRHRVQNDVLTGLGLGVRSATGATLTATDLVIDDVQVGLSVGGGGETSMLTGLLVLDAALGLEIRGPAVTLRSSIVRADVAVEGAPDLRLLGNTLLGRVTLEAPREVVSNASDTDLGPSNVTCGPSCWTDPAAGDFYPASDSPLLGAGTPAVDDALFEDFCHRERTEPRTAGAIQWTGPDGYGPFTQDFKSAYPCVTGFGGLPSLPPASPGEPAGCACDALTSPASGLVLPLALLVRRRRRNGATSRNEPPLVPWQPQVPGSGVEGNEGSPVSTTG